jgi:hypothetical protein
LHFAGEFKDREEFDMICGTLGREV